MMQMATAYAMNLKWQAVQMKLRVTTIPMPQRTMVLVLRWMNAVSAEERASQRVLATAMATNRNLPTIAMATA